VLDTILAKEARALGRRLLGSRGGFRSRGPAGSQTTPTPSNRASSRQPRCKHRPRVHWRPSRFVKNPWLDAAGRTRSTGNSAS